MRRLLILFFFVFFLDKKIFSQKIEVLNYNFLVEKNDANFNISKIQKSFLIDTFKVIHNYATNTITINFHKNIVTLIDSINYEVYLCKKKEPFYFSPITKPLIFSNIGEYSFQINDAYLANENYLIIFNKLSLGLAYKLLNIYTTEVKLICNQNIKIIKNLY